MIRNRISRLLTEMGKGIYEKETDMALALLAALSGESIILLGPPGTAKSMVARRLKSCFKDARGFEYLMSRFSTPDEIFGPVSISLLKTSDRYERVIEGYLPTADVVFLDEIWKAGPAIQNTLLTVINEKTFRNGDHEISLPLKLLVAASNELPTKGEGLEALWDRFVIRLESRSISRDDNFRKMLEATTNDDHDITVANPITSDEYAQWSRQICQVVIPDSVFACLFSIKRSLQSVKIDADENRTIYVSDRRWKNIARLLRTSAFMHDRNAVSPTDLLFVHHCLWQEPEERDSLRSMVIRAVFEPLSIQLATLKSQLNADIRSHRANPLHVQQHDYSAEIDTLADSISCEEKAVAAHLLISADDKQSVADYLKEMYKALAFTRQDLMKLDY
ncbi:MAG: AAA family ATPase [Prevotellaceae bacterium]|nr:AAA family ATPase [Prevotellaceae bacterium]